MKRLPLLMAVTMACSKQSQPIEKTYPMTATIVSRDPAKNTVKLDNKEVPGQMAAMRVDYEVRGANVAVTECESEKCNESDSPRAEHGLRHVLGNPLGVDPGLRVVGSRAGCRQQAADVEATA